MIFPPRWEERTDIWFAWRPVDLEAGGIAWLENVERKTVHNVYDGWHYEYRALQRRAAG